MIDGGYMEFKGVSWGFYYGSYRFMDLDGKMGFRG